MSILNVQFTDDTQTIINGYFNCAQDPSVYKNLGVVDAADVRWKVFYDGLPVSVSEILPAPTAAE
ncbi:hypothetical protein [Paraburkholderia dipogonis]|uniref:hypothetical protein n=1 Tax=Paraburkholderia dipogonis TaxID=1211383 RepID=UPI0038BBA33B